MTTDFLNLHKATPFALAAVDMDYRTLRRYVRAHPDSLQFLEERTKDHLNQSHSVLIASAPAMAERLLQIALDPSTKNYAAVSACQAVFAILDKGGADRESVEQLQAIRESLNALEGTGLLTFRTHQYWAGSNPQMDALAPLNQVAGKNAPSPLLLIMGCIRAFFAGSLMTSLMRGRQEQGWFKGNKEFDE